MRVDDADIRPVIDLGLSLGYANQCIQTRLNNDSGEGAGAGANAGSTLGMTNVTTSPLSELVWSPRKGLRLKCADCSFFKTTPSLLWDTGPRIMVTESSSDKIITEENFMTTLSTCNGRNDEVGRDNSTRFPATDAGILPLSRSSQELNTATDDKEDLEATGGATSLPKKEDAENDKGEVMPDLAIENKISSLQEKVKQESVYNDITLREPIVSSGKEAYDTNMHDTASLSKELEESPSLALKERKSVMDPAPPGDCYPAKLELTDENDLQTVKVEVAYGVASKILCLESEKTNSNHHEMLPGDQALAVKPSPTSNEIHRDSMKGKAKASSDGDLNGRTLNDEEGSHESVESCNSAGPFSTGKEKRSLELQPISGTRNIKMKISEFPSSFGKQDSSFISWISNMVRGGPNGVGAPSLALKIANSDHGRPDHTLNGCSRDKDPACRAMGFHSIFQSLYCPKGKVQEAPTLNKNHQKEETKGPDLSSKICNINATPIACHMVTGNVKKQFCLSNEKFNDSTYDSQTGFMAHPKDASLDGAPHQEINRSNSAGNKNSSELVTDKENDGTSSNSSLCKRKRNNIAKFDSEMPSEGKIARTAGYRSDPLANLWITRFTPKTSRPTSNKDPCNSIAVALDCNTDVMKLKHQLREHQGSLDDLNIVEGRKCAHEDPVCVQNCAASSEASFGYFKVKGHDDELPFPRIKDSEVMASVFAKGLDALKHNTSSRIQHQGECGSSLINKCAKKNRRFNAINEENKMLAHGSASQLQAAYAPTVCDGNNSTWTKGLDLNLESNEGTSSRKTKLNVNLFGKGMVSSFCENTVKKSLITPVFNSVKCQTSDVPQGIFDAVKGLRLSRTDILRWMKSEMPLSHLDGFFLRLRLGKWEDGLGGTGYYVACINGIPRESLTRKSKRSIAVNVGGMKCSVESPFVSNQDFLEDELMAWWSTILRSGSKIPSEEDLRLKAKEKKMLGF